MICRLLALFMLLHTTVYAQVKSQSIAAPDGSLPTVLRKVVFDLPQKCSTIKGELLIDQLSTREYASTVVPNGAIDTKVIQYVETEDKAWSWQSVLAEAADFGKAVQQYRTYYTQIQQGKMIEQRLVGSWVKPDEAKRFHQIIFTLQPEKTITKAIRVELQLQFVLDSWQVVIIAYETLEG